MEVGTTLKTDLPAVEAAVPGSVQAALRRAGVIPDWNVGLNSRLCEWVEHRHWEYIVEIPEGFFETNSQTEQGQEIWLVAEGLDHRGWIMVDNQEVGEFCGMLQPHRFALSKYLGDGKRHCLGLVFDKPPTEQGQIGYTSWSRYFKPRFNYGWDWCPRFVPIGIWDDLYFHVGTNDLQVERVRAELSPDNATGRLSVIAGSSTKELTFCLRREGKIAWQTRAAKPAGRGEFSFDGIPVEAWWPNRMGGQPLYELEVSSGEETAKYTLGFKRIEWRACEDAADDAREWICVVNGRPVFLQGVNWTPIRTDYASVTEDDYRKYLSLYKDMGCNLLRVWGGAFLEKECFYRLCDEMGLMIWQEFPLSSSGIDNWAPEEPEVIERLCDIARSYIRRRGHHACKLLWCGGNELQHAPGKKTGDGVPLDFDHPCLRELKKVVEQEDPGVRMLPTSSSGPVFYARPENFGKGIHHDVHGPWVMDGTLEEWQTYWRADDSLFRSEVGLTGATDLAVTEKYRGTCAYWPPHESNPYWSHVNSWWVQYDRFKDEVEGLPEPRRSERFVALSQALQAQGLAIAARSCKRRFPRCGGFLLWMGHDAFPCLSNTAVIDFDGNPKPAYHALREEFLNTAK